MVHIFRDVTFSQEILPPTLRFQKILLQSIPSLCELFEEFALAVPPIGGLAAAQILLRPYGRHRLQFYCASLGSEVVVTVGGWGTQRLKAQKMKKLSQKCKVTLQGRPQYRTWRKRPFKGDNTSSHFAKVPPKSAIVLTTLRGHVRQV